MSKEVEIIIDKDGNMNIDLEGFRGKECDAAMDALVRGLGKQVKNVKKPEYTATDVKQTAKARETN